MKMSRFVVCKCWIVGVGCLAYMPSFFLFFSLSVLDVVLNVQCLSITNKRSPNVSDLSLATGARKRREMRG